MSGSELKNAGEGRRDAQFPHIGCQRKPFVANP
jgi:hypothetical protein